jgi:hypothetical protein
MGRARSEVPVRRSRRPWPSAFTALGALVVVLFGMATSLAVVGRTGAGLSFVALPVALLGLVIARRQPGNRIAWLLLSFSAVFAVYGMPRATRSGTTASTAAGCRSVRWRW